MKLSNLQLCLPLVCLLAARAGAQQTSYTFDGAAAGDIYGTAVANLGDINLDGYDDFAVGAPNANAIFTDAGRVLVYSGKDRQSLFTWSGGAANEHLGASVAGAGDVDLDGHPDIFVGSPDAVVNGEARGKVVLRSGSTGSVLRTYVGPSDQSLFGHAVANAGDVDGDGVFDVVIGAPNDFGYDWGNGPYRAGSVLVYSGASGTLVVKFTSGEWHSRFGWAVAGAGDRDGDGRADILIGSPDYDTGVVWLYSPSHGSMIDLWGTWVDGDQFGTSVCVVGDTDGDGVSDFLFGGTAAGNDGGGIAMLVSGATLDPSWTTHGSPDSHVGASVAAVGDVDGDGRADYAIGAPKADLGLLGDVGAVYIKSGANGALLHTLWGSGVSTGFSSALATGDFNGDGALDLLVGSPLAANGGTNSGSARLVLMNDAAGTPFCFGDGSGSACPCDASPSSAHAGCPNSTGNAGKLVATGNARISQDNVKLHGSGMPNSTCLYFQGTGQVNGGMGAPFADGLRCVNGTVKRLGARSNIFGGSTFPYDSEPSLSELGGALAGQTLHYQVWYRNPVLFFCTEGLTNYTNGFSITWQP